MIGAALASAGCGGGSNVTYIKMAPQSSSGFTGTDCPGSSGGTTYSFSGIDGDGTIAIYPEPNGKYFLDIGSGAGLEGTLAGSNYSFNGAWSSDVKQNDEIQTQESVTLTLTSVGGGFTGTFTIEDRCQSGNNDACGGGNPLTGGNAGNPFTSITAGGVGSTDGKDFDCTQTETVAAVQVQAVEEVSGTAATPPASPTAPFP
jgi:hypothetical protein